jgi:methyltransferase of ATP-grasp peptide maturase system
VTPTADMPADRPPGMPTDMPIDTDADAARLRGHLVAALADAGVLADLAWRKAAETVPRHAFVPGFYLPRDGRDEHGLTVWDPVTARTDYGRWLAAAYRDDTLITQFDGDEPDWEKPAVRHGGTPTSSSTLPSLVLRMWADADIADDHRVLEVGTGTGYSTALACERLGSTQVTSIEVDPHRLDQAAGALFGSGYTPALAAADGVFGYWPRAPYDRIVAACSLRHVPPALLAQTRPGGKLLLTLVGWLYGHARVLLTANGDGTAEGPLLPGTVSFMPARTHAAPMFGDPARWADRITGPDREARHTPDRITDPTAAAFHTRFLAQTAVPNAQLVHLGDVVHLVDVASGSAAHLTRDGTGDRGGDDGAWRVRESGPVRLWERIEQLLDAYDAADRPRPETFRLHVTPDVQVLRHRRMPAMPLPAP